MISGIIFFESGEVQIIGKITTVRNIAQSIRDTLPNLIKQERDQLFATITDDELKQIIDMRNKHSDDE